MSKKVFIKNFGCQMNVRDSEVICGLLKQEGYVLTDDQDKADIIIFNTCSVRQHAEDKVWSEVGRAAKNPKKKIIGITGCMARNYEEGIFERAPGVDFAVGPSDIHRIPAVIRELSVNNLFEKKIWETRGDRRPDEIYHTGFYEDDRHAYVVISQGCLNHCSYCVVPYVRGTLHNRDPKDILREIEEAADRGITGITLLGQNVNAYKSTIDFIGLLKEVNSVKALREFSFVTSHPRDTSNDLFRAIAGLEKLKKYLHMPVQSGSDRILKLMNRGYTRKFYLDLADNYRKIVKDAILTTDIIVGFPSETEEDFLDTHNLIKCVEFDAAYIFKYSPRPHTEAAKLADDVGKEEKERRHGIILGLQKGISKGKRC